MFHYLFIVFYRGFNGCLQQAAQIYHFAMVQLKKYLLITYIQHYISRCCPINQDCVKEVLPHWSLSNVFHVFTLPATQQQQQRDQNSTKIMSHYIVIVLIADGDMGITWVLAGVSLLHAHCSTITLCSLQFNKHQKPEMDRAYIQYQSVSQIK